MSKNEQNKQLVENLENSLDENEINLEKQLQILQKENTELIDLIKTLQSQLDARSSVYQEKKDIEAVLKSERKAKEQAEKARRQLESRMEELLAKKSKFMCF
ncbi:hypothetical protein RhiirA4_510430 [Rhizophagus irregularis]|uniref:Uncharacterized protein n=1 Tax=Rhizophagus irregularis TaxID=588596 RepID=A0A2I1HFH8_9GLOM|nr:hypothetical protein RhiirA4_510430 [Rhizophagus irregularis]